MKQDEAGNSDDANSIITSPGVARNRRPKRRGKNSASAESQCMHEDGATGEDPIQELQQQMLLIEEKAEALVVTRLHAFTKQMGDLVHRK